MRWGNKKVAEFSLPPRASFRFATLTSTTLWGEEKRNQTQQPTIRPKVPNSFQDLTIPLPGRSSFKQRGLAIEPAGRARRSARAAGRR